MTDQNDNLSLPPYFDQYPDVRDRLLAEARKVPQKERQKLVTDFLRFVTGEATWGEIINFPKILQKEVAKIGYMLFKKQDYQKAESLFKGLTIMDHTNWYYRVALGAIFQKTKRYDDAIEEYTLALSLNPGDPSCLVNRGQCFMQQGENERAVEDFKRVLNLNLTEDNPWRKRCEVLHQQLEHHQDNL